MAKIGSYDYPEASINDVVRYAEILVNDFHKKINDINEFASRLGHKSANSGPFSVKLSDMRKFGLMDKREFRSTQRAEIIANPVGNEKQMAIKEMILGVPLFEKLNTRLKTRNPTIEQFKTQLIEVTGNREKASKEAEKIRKIYIGAISHIREGIDKKVSEEGFTEDKLNMGNQKMEQIGEEALLFKSGKVNLVLPKDDSHIDILISVLQKMKSKK